MDEKFAGELQISVHAWLLKKRAKVNGRDVQCLGVAEFHACPSKHGLGEFGMRVAEAIAREQNVDWLVGFTDEPTVAFYKKIGWQAASNKIKSFDGTMKVPVYKCLAEHLSSFTWLSLNAVVEPVGQDW